MSGFAAVAVALDREGRGAILRDAAGRILLLRPHGSHLAGRLLTPSASARIDGQTLVIHTAERRFGSARLHLADPSAWAKAIEAIKEGRHA